MGTLCKDTLNCCTCAAHNTNTFFKDETFDTKNYSIVTLWENLKTIHGYENLTRADKIAKLSVFMKDKREERKSLSMLGASRLSRKEALRFLHSKEKVQNYYTLMVQTTSSTGAYQL
eukprot:13330945-Heterocapsa_arctica.AAC.1